MELSNDNAVFNAQQHLYTRALIRSWAKAVIRNCAGKNIDLRQIEYEVQKECDAFCNHVVNASSESN